jgi:hypothetical protein
LAKFSRAIPQSLWQPSAAQCKKFIKFVEIDSREGGDRKEEEETNERGEMRKVDGGR